MFNKISIAAFSAFLLSGVNMVNAYSYRTWVDRPACMESMTQFENYYRNDCPHFKDNDERYQFQTVYFNYGTDEFATRAQVICSYLDTYNYNKRVLFNQEVADSLCAHIVEQAGDNVTEG
ncbi:uncharacterized protein L201_005185 [Kwoniella dendrophila CBS 6074]|uniref:Uncharacterized protein n=1 Tax=Kwoniella dendrophila CBS 6074 TaxID=1295534 RepID=A0AAX4JZW8_9TREE